MRNISEFAYGGEVEQMPPPSADDAAWANYLFYRDNAAGVVREWWCHIATSYWFIAERDTRTDEILRTYAPDQLEFAPPDGDGTDENGEGGPPA